VLGRFHEIGISTADIRASVEFYERLGFSQAQTADTWPHPYGVLTDGRIFLGLHQSAFDSPTLTFVHADLAHYGRELQSQGLQLAYQRTAEHEFNTIGLKDPAGQMLALIEARTYSPVPRRPQRVSLCGYFEEFSMPSTDFAAAKAYWERCGFVATEETDLPYPHLALMRRARMIGRCWCFAIRVCMSALESCATLHWARGAIRRMDWTRGPMGCSRLRRARRCSSWRMKVDARPCALSSRTARHARPTPLIAEPLQ